MIGKQRMDKKTGVLQLRDHVGWTSITLPALPPAGPISNWDGSIS